MYTTRAFMSGKSQAILIPKEYHFGDGELVVDRIGDSLIITPVKSLRDTFFAGIEMLSEDFLKEGRPEEVRDL